VINAFDRRAFVYARDMNQNKSHQLSPVGPNFNKSFEEMQGKAIKQAAGPNVRFYLHAMPCRPDNLTIDTLVSRWHGQHALLENQHGYIQWLFPLRDAGVNHMASPLNQSEIKTLRSSQIAKARMLSALDMMLEFYGMQWQDDDMKQLSRTSSYEPCYSNLLHNRHNFLRISRILQSLCLFGLGAYTTPIVLYVLAEISAGELQSLSLQRSLQAYWIDCLPEADRRFMHALARRVLHDNFALTQNLYIDFLHNLRLRSQSDAACIL
jgi:hypothetical protein